MSAPNIKTTHVGKKIVRIRELKGMKQETLANKMGVSQQTISRIEKSETLDKEKLKQVADALGISVEAIENFSEENAIFNIQNNYDSSTNNINYQSNPVDKIVELYERLLKTEQEKNILIDTLLKKISEKL